MTIALIVVAVILATIPVMHYYRRIVRLPVPSGPPGKPGAPITNDELFSETLGSGFTMRDMLVARSLDSLKRHFPSDAELMSLNDYYTTTKRVTQYRLSGDYGTVNYFLTHSRIDLVDSVEVRAELDISDVSYGPRVVGSETSLAPGTRRGVRLRDDMSRVTEQYGKAQGMLWTDAEHMLRYYAPAGTISFYMDRDNNKVISIIVDARVNSAGKDQGYRRPS